MNPTPPTSTTQFSFEHILNWFGKFTPQFKFKLMALRRELPLNQFDALMNETMQLFRAYIADLGNQPTPAARAQRSHDLMEAEMNANPVTNVSCGSGCGACCKSFANQITTD
ncbi:MAG TPA: hypothetical protein VM432_00155, partial [Bdellovibrionales bacterium]|nr:hypothetical protein [Bdellovibrionales bacterium]